MGSFPEPLAHHRAKFLDRRCRQFFGELQVYLAHEPTPLGRRGQSHSCLHLADFPLQLSILDRVPAVFCHGLANTCAALGGLRSGAQPAVQPTPPPASHRRGLARSTASIAGTTPRRGGRVTRWISMQEPTTRHRRKVSLTQPVTSRFMGSFHRCSPGKSRSTWMITPPRSSISLYFSDAPFSTCSQAHADPSLFSTGRRRADLMMNGLESL